MTNIFHAIGEHQDDPYRLLLLGDDGRYYEQKLPEGAPLPTEPDPNTWRIDRDAFKPEPVFVLAFDENPSRLVPANGGSHDHVITR